MQLDRQADFYEKFTFTASGNSDIFDAAGNINLGNALMRGGMLLAVALSAVGGTSPTLAFNLVGADDSGFSTNKITIAAYPATAAVNGTFYVGLPPHTPKRYYRLESTIGGTGGPTMVISAGFTQIAQQGIC